jgi:hypothetical protein
MGDQRRRFVLLVAVKPCKPLTLSDPIRRSELYGVSGEAAGERFRTFMGRAITAPP